MKKWYKIGLFFICIIIVCLIIFVLWKRHSYAEKFIGQSPERQELDLPREITQTNQSKIMTSQDTICIYEERNQNDGSVQLKKIKLPEKYIGMTRQELELTLKNECVMNMEYEKSGLVSQYLASFSKEKIKIIRIFDKIQEEMGYFIIAQEQHVCVYKADKQTLYFESEILLEDLPLSVQEEVIQGKYMSSEMEVFHFLESYSS